jgi:hypothetical protein
MFDIHKGITTKPRQNTLKYITQKLHPSYRATTQGAFGEEKD